MKIYTLLLALLLGMGCSSSDDDPAPTTFPATVVQGVSLSPRSFENDDFVQFLEMVDEAGQYVTWAGDWIQLADTNSAPFVVAALGQQYNFEPILLTSWFNTSTGAPFREMTDSTKRVFNQYVQNYAARVQPPFIVCGVELNTAYDHSEQNFLEFAFAFYGLRDSIRAVSPNTKVGVDFLWETMLGYHGGLFGGTNDTAATQFDLIAEFPAADFIGFNSYPSLIFADPDSIPANHYSRMLDVADKHIALFECGWHTGTEIPGWAGNEAAQARYTELLLANMTALEPLVVIWPFMFDQQIVPPFNTMGLWDRDTNQPKAAWSVWIGAAQP